MGEKSSFMGSALGKTEVFNSPSGSRQHQCVCGNCMADELSTGGFRRWHLKTQYRFLSGLRAGSAKVRRLPEALFGWLLSKDADGPVSKVRDVVVNKLLALSYNSGKVLFKFEIFVLEPRQLRLQERLLALHFKHCALNLDESSKQVRCCKRDLVSVTLGDQAFGNCLGAAQRCERNIHGLEHGCPSGGVFRVEEPAFSTGEGIHPKGATQKEVTHG